MFREDTYNFCRGFCTLVLSLSESAPIQSTSLANKDLPYLISTWVASPCLSSSTCLISGTDLHISMGVTWFSVSVNILEQS